MNKSVEDRFERIERNLEQARQAMNGKRDRLDHIEELLRMAAVQTAENAKQIARFSREFGTDLAKSRKEHDREMKEIRALFKQMIRRIAA